jgi:aldose sugar dehydrogenase
MKILITILALISFNLKAAPLESVLSFKTEDKKEYVVDKLADGFGVIWAMDFLSPQKMIFTEIKGQIHTLDLKSGTVRTLKNPPTVHQSGQGGLLDIALHPNFEENSLVYVTYSKRIRNQQTTAVARAKLILEEEKFEAWEDIFVAQPTFSTAHHYGSRIAFDDKDHIFFTVGDRGQQDLAQSLKAHNGKVIRLKTDGTIPADNPFVNTPDARKEIWSYGHRNPQGLFWDQESGTLYEQEHGPRGGDEINIIKPGKNYGWPVITHGREYSGQQVGAGISEMEGMEQPIKYFTPSIAPSSLLVYRDGPLKVFRNKFLSAALALQHLNSVDLKDPNKENCEERFMIKLNERLRDVVKGPDGLVYISSDSGRVYRIKEGN